MRIAPRPSRGGRRLSRGGRAGIAPGRSAAALLAAALVLAGCSAAAEGPGPSGGSAGPATGSAADPTAQPTGAGSGMTVTVPGLGSTSGGDDGAGESGDPPASGPAGTEPAAPTGGGASTVTVTATASAAAGTGPAGGDVGTTAPADRTTAPTDRAIAPADRTTASAAADTGSAAADSIAVDLSACDGCTVIATHRGVTGTLSAALASTARGAVLLSVRPDGGIAGVIRVPYGASFPAPDGGLLPCDESGRCVVTGRQSGGNAILSAFALTSDGAWRDVSAGDGFPSATADAAITDVDGDGLLDIAVQESAGDLIDWMVLTWSGERFTVLGCAVASGPVPPADELSPDVCLS